MAALENSRTVRYVIKRALLRNAVETPFAPAPDIAYDLAFNSFIDMLDEWREKGIIIYQENPSNINQGLGSADCTNALINCLAVRIAPDFSLDATMSMRQQASNSFRVLRNRFCCIPQMSRPKNMPRGSGNTWYKNSKDACEDNLQTENNVNITTG